MKSVLALSVALSALFLSACAHHRDVRAGADGINRVVVKTEDTEEGSRNAISQANHFCEQFKKTPAFINEDSKYTGDMDEKDYKTGKKVAKVAKMVGGAAWVFGGKNERNLGGIGALGGSVGDAVLGKGYTVEMRFKCQ